MCAAGQRVSLTITGPGPSFSYLPFQTSSSEMHPSLPTSGASRVTILFTAGLPRLNCSQKEIGDIKHTVRLDDSFHRSLRCAKMGWMKIQVPWCPGTAQMGGQHFLIMILLTMYILSSLTYPYLHQLKFYRPRHYRMYTCLEKKIFFSFCYAIGECFIFSW